MFKGIMFSISLSMVLVACGGGSSSSPVVNPSPPPPPPPPARIDVLWPDIVTNYLTEELWLPQFNYDAAHLLMLPAYYAFNIADEQAKKQEFIDFFKKYDTQLEGNLDSNIQRRFFFFFLTSNFLKWCDCESQNFQPLINKLVAQTERVWTTTVTRTFGFPDFANYKESVEWKLNGGPGGTIDYGNAFFDDELNILTTGAVLKSILQAYKLPESSVINEISAIAQRVLLEKGEFQDDGGWIFQPGVWANYEDYRYAGHSSSQVGLSPSPVNGIGTDSSHIARMPLWLDAVSGSAAPDEKAKLINVKKGFEKQFMQHGLVLPDATFSAPRLNNYISGHNGIYRYNYIGFTPGDAYQPYQLSGALVSNWYPFLKSDDLRAVYDNLSKTFPLDQNVVSVYVGPEFDRSGAFPLIRFPDFFNNGFAELYSLIAKRM